MFFFFNDTATTEIYTLSLHDALPIWQLIWDWVSEGGGFPTSRSTKTNSLASTYYDQVGRITLLYMEASELDRKSTRLNSSHSQISYAVFCLKKKNIRTISVHVQCVT